MPYGYIDPVQRHRQQQALRGLAQLGQQQPVQQYPVQPLHPVQSPLANLPNAQREIIYGNGRESSGTGALVAIAAVLLGVLGGGVVLWANHNRKTRGQNTTPVFRALMVFLAFLIPGLVVSASVHFTGHGVFAAVGFVLGAVLAVRYHRRTPNRSPTVTS